MAGISYSSKSIEEHSSVVAVAKFLHELHEPLKCRICLEVSLVACRLPCTHAFCTCCIQNYMLSTKRKKLNCPLCNAPDLTRRSFRPHDSLRSLATVVQKLHQQLVESTKHLFDLRRVESLLETGRGDGRREAPRSPIQLSRTTPKLKTTDSPSLRSSRACEPGAPKPQRKAVVELTDVGFLGETAGLVHRLPTVTSVNTGRATIQSHAPNSDRGDQSGKDAQIVTSTNRNELAEPPDAAGKQQVVDGKNADQTEESPNEKMGNDVGKERKQRVLQENRQRVVFQFRGKLRSECLTSRRRKKIPFLQMGVLAPSNRSENELNKVPSFEQILRTRTKKRKVLLLHDNSSTHSTVLKRAKNRVDDRLVADAEHSRCHEEEDENGTERREGSLMEIENDLTQRKKSSDLNRSCHEGEVGDVSDRQLDVGVADGGAKKFTFKSMSSLSLSKRNPVSETAALQGRGTNRARSIELLPDREMGNDASVSVLENEEAVLKVNVAKRPVSPASSESDQVSPDSNGRKDPSSRYVNEEEASTTIDEDDSDDDLFPDTPQSLGKRSFNASHYGRGGGARRTSLDSRFGGRMARRSVACRVSPEPEKPRPTLREILDGVSLTLFKSFEFLLHGVFSPSSEANQFGKLELARVIRAGGGIIVTSIHKMSFTTNSVGLCIVDDDDSQAGDDGGGEHRKEFHKIFTCSNVAVVSKSWLLKCVRQGRPVSIRPFLQHSCDEDALLNADYPQHLAE